MTPLLFLAISLAGGLGAVSRLTLDGLIRSRLSSTFPFGTFAINATGSLALGFFTGLLIANMLPEGWYLVIGTGFLGGYTTFSTASFETVRLLQEKRWGAAAFNGFGVLATCVAAAAFGLWLGGLA
ncbi:CrcB protein [Microbacterium endophyticum]|uniref:Fluoride-specific ion channel FluC n=1 Tax=Microbacterium endophyticum TaxID=1526412 RepID=A0A7W4V0P6_9MICO|nr:fluoride efflux transporter CrcB [Microbacterium endophyticum]MBB2974713.1 CrcB protein [Microbacterium endophyticum]NIK37010.1 CrcB protein [Microbacterium endophyticum]